MKTTSKQTDNKHLIVKLELRRYFLTKYAEPFRVFDCCQGDGVIWSTLQREFPIENYYGVDLKPKPGRLKIDSLKILQQPGWTDNVIDIDTYGAPWSHWEAVVRHCERPLTVFLTWGRLNMTATENALEQKMGIPFDVPSSLSSQLGAEAVRWAFHTNQCNLVEVKEALEPTYKSRTRYFGARIEPK